MYFSINLRKGRPKTDAEIEETFRLVHLQNLSNAETANLTLDDWHKQMSEKGNAPIPATKQEDSSTEIYNSADYVLSYLFPRVKSKRKK